MHSAPAAPEAHAQQQETSSTPTDSGQLPPTITIPNVEDDTVYDRDLTPRIVIRSRNLRTSTVKLDEQPYVEGTAIAAEGTHTLAVSADDENGTSSSLKIRFTIDKTPPATSISVNGSFQGENGMHHVRSGAKLVVTAEDPGTGSSGISRTDCRIDGGKEKSYTDPLNIEGLEEGTHTLLCISRDRAGNIGQETKLMFAVSNSPPTTVITLSPPKKALTGGRFMASPATVFSLFASGAPSGIARTEYQLDGGPWNAYAPFTIPGSGEHTIRYRSTDRLGNEEASKSLSVVIDEKPPITTLKVGEPHFQGPGNSLYVAPITGFALSAASPVIGVAKTEYRIDNGRWNEYAPFTIRSEGRHLVEFRGIDVVGNEEPAQSQKLTVDATPPTTSISADGHKIDPAVPFFTKGTNTFTLAASDKLSGVKITEYRVGTGPWTMSTPIEFKGQGTRTIEFRSVDNVGNEEEPQILTVKVDNEPPVSVLQLGNPHITREGKIYASEKTVLTVTASDPLSGVIKTEYRIDDGGWRPSAPFTLPLGSHSIEYRSTDKVGNQEQPSSAQIVVDDSPPATAVLVGGKKFSADTVVIKGEAPIQLASTSAVWGVKATEFRLDGGEWNSYSGGIAFKEEGKYLLEFRSTDTGGKEEGIQSINVVVDRTPPVSSISIGTPKHEVEGKIQVEPGTLLTPAATDELSGIQKVEYQLKGQPVESDGVPFSLTAPGTYEISYWSVDKAGNREKPHKLTVKVSPAPTKFSPEDLLLANEIPPPAVETVKEPISTAQADVGPMPSPETTLPDLSPEEPIQTVLPNRPPQKKLMWTMGILQILLIIGVMAL